MEASSRNESKAQMFVFCELDAIMRNLKLSVRFLSAFTDSATNLEMSKVDATGREVSSVGRRANRHKKQGLSPAPGIAPQPTVRLLQIVVNN